MTVFPEIIATLATTKVDVWLRKTGKSKPRRSGRDPDRPHKKIGWNLPRFADLVNHLNRERASAI
jgi:hypothetical protein